MFVLALILEQPFISVELENVLHDKLNIQLFHRAFQSVFSHTKHLRIPEVAEMFQGLLHTLIEVPEWAVSKFLLGSVAVVVMVCASQFDPHGREGGLYIY